MTAAGRVFKITKTKGSPIEIPKEMSDGDTLEIWGDELEDRSSEAEPDRAGGISIYYKDFSVISTYPETGYHLVFKNGQREILGTFNLSHVMSIDGPDVVHVGDFAFTEAELLEELRLPSLRSIGKCAFQHCLRLKPFRITREIEHIGDGAFTGCALIKSFDVDPDNEHYESVGGALYRKAEGDGGRRTLVSWAAGCPEACVEVAGDIGESAFEGAMHLEEIRLVDAVSIGPLAFDRCMNVRRICLPATLTDFSLSAFRIRPKFNSREKTSITSFEVDPDNHLITSKDGVIYSKDLTELLVYPPARSDEEFACEEVISVRAGAFNFCHSVKRVSLPNVLRVDARSFFSCGQLIIISLPSIEEVCIDPDDRMGNAIDACPARLIRIGKEPPLNARRLVGCMTSDADMHDVFPRVLVPDLSRYTDYMSKWEAGSTNTNDEQAIYGLTELPEGGAFGVDVPLKSVFRIRIGDEVTTDIGKRCVQLICIADHPLNSNVFYDPKATLRNRRLKRKRLRKFINKTKIFLRELRTLHPDAYTNIELIVEHNWIWDQHYGEDPCFVDVEPPHGCSRDRPYWEIRLILQIMTPRRHTGGVARTWICGSMVQDHIRDDLSWLWEELGNAGFGRGVSCMDDGLTWDVNEVLGIEEEDER